MDFATASSDQSQARKVALEKISELDAPGWFKEAFGFICKDLTDIRDNLHRIEECEKDCTKNSLEINNLKSKVATLEKKMLQLEKIDLANRKNNLIVHGLQETGPNEDVKSTLKKFMQETLKVPSAAEMTYDEVYRMGKRPHLVPGT